MLGKTISHYKVLEKIGEGGMGEVYRATDTKLNRDVALKILPEQFASDNQRMGRFQREAEVLASLDHPNIGQIYGIEETGQTKALVLQLIEGPTLADKIAKGPIPLEDALKIALQMAEGLEAAHEKGVIHRDLKPANIKITPEGTVKVLDFGLAKALEDEAPEDIHDSPTISQLATKAGIILGTAAYMSPEQARGKTVDRRTDIWAFGVVLFEMLTGNNSFEGEDISLTLAAVMKEDPDWEVLPNNTPAPIDSVLRRCLDKDPSHRLQHIGDARIPIQDCLADPSAYEVAATVALQPSERRQMIAWLLASVVVTVIITLIAVLALWSPPLNPTPMRRLTVNLGPTEPIPFKNFSAHVALSPDGTRLVYAAQVDGTRQLYMRPLDQLEAQPIPGTNGAKYPFFSPDGEWVGFFTPDFDNKLKRILVRGGPPQILCDAHGQAPGGSWGADDTIVFSLSAPGLFSVPATGGTPRALTAADAEQGEHQWPEILPGGHSVLFHIVPQGGAADDSNIAVLSLQTGKYQTLIEGGHNARYAPTGHVVFGRAGALWAVAFDLNRLEKTGPEAPILEGIQVTRSGVAPYSFSDDGLLVYLPAGEVDTKRTLVWVDREGNEEPFSAEPRAYLYPRLSPDGSRLAVTIDDLGNRDIWIYDLGRQTPTRLTFDAASDQVSVWTPDGQRVVFYSAREGASNLFWKAADGTGQVEHLRTSPDFHLPSSFSPDGKSLVFYERKGSSPYEIGVLSMEGERTSKLLLQNEFDEMRPAISLDGRWIAYMSNEAGRGEIYVRPFPNVEDAKWQISTDGGISPFWAANGEELFYSNADAMMVVRIETEPSFRHGSPQVLFTGSYVFAGARNYDISPDGKRFLMIKEGEQTGEIGTELIVVQNWFEELKRLVPTP